MSLQPTAESGCRRLPSRRAGCRQLMGGCRQIAPKPGGPEGRSLCFRPSTASRTLGAAQGFGKEAKNLQAARAKTAFERLRWVARLGLPRQALCRLAGSSALVAGMFGAACHVYDRDVLKTLRSWVTHALYRGSRFAQPRLFARLELPSLAADP